ncbi:hypothetical protein K438DRAFT_1872386 [Mycena galopus ATCC 62051]|nr:hypothetical protein K438DRAFT_1872386 [Mycena galopus ATCC 62051]
MSTTMSSHPTAAQAGPPSSAPANSQLIRIPIALVYLASLPLLCLAKALPGADRSLSAALQNVNGMSSIFSLIPVLTGKVQNMKMIAARTFPGSLAIAGLGGGRVLTKMQLGVLLLSGTLYQNLVDDFSYHHDEYVNRYSPALIHIPTGTPERHSSNIIINHNPSEAYLVETWFQTQGRPAKVHLKQNNNQRLFCGVLIYLVIHGGEMYIEIRNAATGALLPLLVLQIVGFLCWSVALGILQITRGQSSPTMVLNRLGDPHYRCLQVVLLGHHVSTAVFSFSLECLQSCHIFHSNYSNRTLQNIGTLILVSAAADLISTVLVVGLTTWAYPWLAMQLFIVIIKVAFSLEPLRQIEIKSIEPLEGSRSAAMPARKEDTRLPLKVNTTEEWQFTEICVGHNVVQGAGGTKWLSADPGIYIGQLYISESVIEADPKLQVNGDIKTRYLAIEQKKLTLATAKPHKESNQALQREYLASLAEIVKANKVPSMEFLEAMKITAEGMRKGMEVHWFALGTNDLMMFIQKAEADIFWRKRL